MNRTFYKGVILGAATAVLVLAGAAAVAATGGNFILGQPNTAESTSGLSANLPSGPALGVSNLAGGPAAAFTTAGKVPPFTVSSKGKVAGLNADMVDGKHSAAFLPVAGKAADSDKLDGLDSTAFVQGNGKVMARRVNMNPGDPDTTLFDLGFARLDFRCTSLNDGSDVLVHNTSTQTILLGWSGVISGGGLVLLSPGGTQALTRGSNGESGNMTIGEGDGSTATVASVAFAWFFCQSQALATIQTG